ncbi:MAG: FixH family protein [Burkholderiaceae bacterium]
MTESKPPVIWYKEPWPWILMGIPFVSVVLGVVMIWLATTTNNAMVVDDYYRKGKAINVDISRDKLATSLGLVAQVEVSESKGQIVLDSGGTQKIVVRPAKLSVRFVHSALETLDRTVVASRGTDDTYPFTLDKPISTGRYRVHIEPVGSGWRLVSETILLKLLPSGTGQQFVITSEPLAGLPGKLVASDE